MDIEAGGRKGKGRQRHSRPGEVAGPGAGAAGWELVLAVIGNVVASSLQGGGGAAASIGARQQLGHSGGRLIVGPPARRPSAPPAPCTPPEPWHSHTQTLQNHSRAAAEHSTAPHCPAPPSTHLEHVKEALGADAHDANAVLVHGPNLQRGTEQAGGGGGAAVPVVCCAFCLEEKAPPTPSLVHPPMPFTPPPRPPASRLPSTPRPPCRTGHTP